MRSDGSRFARKLLVGTAAAAAFIAYLPRSASAQTVATPGGLFPSEVYAGTAGDGITTFLGVRYAASPTGALRFARPVAPAPVSGIVEATSFGSPLSANASPFGTASMDEDCLFLNVYVPGSSVASSNSLPVMVFFHGGASSTARAASMIPPIWRPRAIPSSLPSITGSAFSATWPMRR